MMVVWYGLWYVSYRIVPYRIVSYRTVPYRIVSYLYRIASYRTVSYHIVSYRNRTCLVARVPNGHLLVGRVRVNVVRGIRHEAHQRDQVLRATFRVKG